MENTAKRIKEDYGTDFDFYRLIREEELLLDLDQEVAAHHKLKEEDKEKEEDSPECLENPWLHQKENKLVKGP